MIAGVEFFDAVEKVLFAHIHYLRTAHSASLFETQYEASKAVIWAAYCWIRENGTFVLPAIETMYYL